MDGSERQCGAPSHQHVGHCVSVGDVLLPPRVCVCVRMRVSTQGERCLRKSYTLALSHNSPLSQLLSPLSSRCVHFFPLLCSHKALFIDFSLRRRPLRSPFAAEAAAAWLQELYLPISSLFVLSARRKRLYLKTSATFCK